MARDKSSIVDLWSYLQEILYTREEVDSWLNYSGEDGERIMSNYSHEPCRINTFCNSFTKCHQVSDHETWKEVLAAHIQEPVRNFGIGG